MNNRASRFTSSATADGDSAGAQGESKATVDARLILDWDDKADLLAWAINNDRERLTARWFAQHGFTSPVIRWEFGVADIADPHAIQIFEMWTGLIREHSGPLLEEVVTSLSLIDCANASLLTTVADGRDYRYLHYSSVVAGVEGRDWTGRRLSEFAVQSYRGVFYMAMYRVMAKRRIAALIWHQPDDPRHGAMFRRLLLPLCDDAGGVVGYLNANSYQDPPGGQ